MVKKILLTAIIAIATLCGQAQTVGSWRIHSTFGTDLNNIHDTGDVVYFLVSKNLFSYNKSTQEIEAYNRNNKLNDVDISNTYYNPDGKYLMVVYDNSNIDVIKSDGTVINVPDIRDAEMTTSKTVNDITFASGNNAYVATDFGYVLLNDSKWEVRESRLWSTAVSSVAVVGDYLFLVTGSHLMYATAADHHSTLADFTDTEIECNRIRPLGDNRYLMISGWTFSSYYTANSDGTLQIHNTEIVQYYPTSLEKTNSGYIASYSQNGSYYYITLDEQGSNARRTSLSEYELLASSETDGSLWGVSHQGLHKITSDGASSTYVRPNGLTMSTPVWMAYNTALDALYVTSSGQSGPTPNLETETAVNMLKSDVWTDITPTGTNHSGGKYTATYWPLIDPTDGNTYYMSSWYDGILKVTDNKVVLTYDWTNSPMIHALDGYYCFATTSLDRNGNLWAVQGDNSSTPVIVLPQASLQASSVTSRNFYTPSIDNVAGNKRAVLLSCKYSNMHVYSAGSYDEPIIFWNDGGSATASGYTSRTYTTFYDQDDKSYTWHWVRALTEDLNGQVWIGTSNGVVACNPTSAMNDNFSVTRIKVPRNDGTNLADYLLDGQQVNCIAVDGANRKWIGTNTSGLFLVSSDGSTILKQFNTDNSILTSNTVYNVCVNPNTNSVYVITSNGFLEYFSDSTPAEDTYDNVYAYPNPVKPDFAGDITIRGLMENSLIKIADSAGNVFYNTRSSGGMATWNGCDTAGNPVKSGVYFVMMSNTDGSTSYGAVTKIVIIR